MQKIVKCLILSILALGFQSAQAQDKQYKAGIVAFYNLENLFDTINQAEVNDEDDNIEDEQEAPDSDTGFDEDDQDRYV